MNMHLAVVARSGTAGGLSKRRSDGRNDVVLPSCHFGIVSTLRSGAAPAWFIISLLAFLAFSLNSHGFYDLMSTSKLDELLLVTGVAGCIYFCCQQGEEYYRQRTTSLIKLSENLKVESDRLMELANTDSLTGLANRFRFHLSLKEAVEAAQAKSRGFAPFMIDMDGFKEINDTLGHLVGDQTLVEIGTRLQAEFGQCYSGTLRWR